MNSYLIIKKSHCNLISNNLPRFLFPSWTYIKSSVPRIKSNFVPSTGTISIKAYASLNIGFYPSLCIILLSQFVSISRSFVIDIDQIYLLSYFITKKFQFIYWYLWIYNWYPFIYCCYIPKITSESAHTKLTLIGESNLIHNLKKL